MMTTLRLNELIAPSSFASKKESDFIKNGEKTQKVWKHLKKIVKYYTMSTGGKPKMVNNQEKVNNQQSIM